MEFVHKQFFDEIIFFDGLFMLVFLGGATLGHANGGTMHFYAFGMLLLSHE